MTEQGKSQESPEATEACVLRQRECSSVSKAANEVEEDTWHSLIMLLGCVEVMGHMSRAAAGEQSLRKPCWFGSREREKRMLSALPLGRWMCLGSHTLSVA